MTAKKKGQFLLSTRNPRQIPHSYDKSPGIAASGWDPILSYLMLLLSKLDTIVLVVPGLERVRVNVHDSALDKSVRSNKFVVGRIVSYCDQTSFPRDRLRSP